MARYNEVLAARFNRLIQKLLSMKGPATLVSIDDSMQAVIPLFHGVENRYLEAWERFGLSAVQAAVAGQNSVVQIRNPSTSGIIIVLEKIQLTVSAGDQINVQLVPDAADLVLFAPQAERFDRRGRGGSVGLISGSNNIALAGFQIAAPNLSTLVPFDLFQFEEQELPILPGDVYRFQTNGVNESLRVTLWWRERPLEDSEKA